VSRDGLKTYLNDHLAGSVMAIELADRTIRENEGGPVAARLSPLVERIREDQTVLKDVIDRLGTGESSLKKAGGWLAEKVGRVKLGGTDEPGELSRLEVLEMLTTGVHGKRALWRALRVVTARYEELRGLDLDLLERRAVEQHDELEAMRLEAAKAAL
jgi:hypothetical protein